MGAQWVIERLQKVKIYKWSMKYQTDLKEGKMLLQKSLDALSDPFKKQHDQKFKINSISA